MKLFNKKQILIILFFLSFFVIYPNEKSIGNRFYSKQNIFIYQSVMGGLIGTKDFFAEDILFKYQFKSENKHAFSIRTYHMSFAPGLFSNNLEKYHFGILLGFEYLYKILKNDTGLILFFDAGFCNYGFAINTGLGIGNRYSNGIIVSFTYLFNSCFFSLIDFYFNIFKYFSLRGNMGITLKYNMEEIDIFSFYGGVFPGFSVRKNFKFEIGGGFTVDDYFIFRWFAKANIVLNFDF